MPVKKKSTRVKLPALSASGSTGGKTDPAVIAFLRDLDHPMKKEIGAARKIILGVSPDIGEGIKWKAPSFRAADYFATVNLRSNEAAQFIFHTGAKPKQPKSMRLADPAGLVKWIAKDRCFVTIGAGTQVQKNRAAFEAVIREWLAQL